MTDCESADGKRRCTICGREGYNAIPALGDSWICRPCDSAIKRVPAHTAGSIIRENLMALRKLEKP